MADMKRVVSRGRPVWWAGAGVSPLMNTEIGCHEICIRSGCKDTNYEVLGEER